MDSIFRFNQDSFKGHIIDDDRRLFKIWADSLREDNLSLVDTIARELADYLNTGTQEVKAFWVCATSILKMEWEQKKPETEEEIVSFYNTSITYIYELCYWHTLEMNEASIKNVKSLELALQQPGRNYLDFGGGTGSNIILFAKHGFNCTLADISSSILDFARWRLKRHGIMAEVVDLKHRQLGSEAYDFVTIVDTLEHVVNPVEVMKELVRVTKRRGIIAAWVPFLKDEERPMHLVIDMNVVSQFPSLGLEELKSVDIPFVKIYRKM